MAGKQYCYQRIKDYIRERIDAGLYQDKKIESENQLAQQFSTSRMTVRQALSSLQDEGYIYTIPKKGSFVSTKTLVKELDGLRSFTEDMKATVQTYSQVLFLEKIDNPTSDITSQDVWYMGRVRMCNQEAVAYEEGYFDAELLPALTQDILENSLYQYIENDLQYTLDYAKQDISAVHAPDVCQKLHRQMHTPLLKMSQMTYLKNNRCIEICDTYYICDHYTFKQNAYRRK